MKAVVAAFNQEKALVSSRGFLRDYEPSDGTFSSTSPDPHLSSSKPRIVWTLFVIPRFQVTEDLLSLIFDRNS